MPIDDNMMLKGRSPLVIFLTETVGGRETGVGADFHTLRVNV